MKTLHHLAILGALAGLAACGPTPPVQKPVASIEEIMRNLIDPAADEVWGSVATIVTRKGAEEKRPRSAAEWLALKNHAQTLVEAGNLLLIKGRRVAPPGTPAEFPEELAPDEVQKLVDAKWPAFAERAAEFRAAAEISLTAIERKDADALLAAGSALDAACERCHMQFWYPNSLYPHADGLKPAGAAAR